MRLAAIAPELLHELENFFGADLSDLHARQEPLLPYLGLRAVARGEQLLFAPGEWDPVGSRGRELIAHEVAHILQQRAGRVHSAPGIAVVEDSTLEQEADQAAREFLHGLAWSRRHADVSGCAPSASSPWQAARVRLDQDDKKSGLFSSKNEYEKFLYDFKLIQTWMTNRVEFLPALKHLNDVVDRTKQLTAELLRREQEYGLNAGGQAPIYTDVLSGAEFVAMNARGVLPKDHVTPEHGEYTHRLHWYIVLYKASSGFTKAPSAVFYNTPLQILKASTKKDYKPPKQGWPEVASGFYETSTFSMWEALFDRRPFPDVYSLAEDHISCPEMFTALLVPPDKDRRPTLFGYQELALKVPRQATHYSLVPSLPALSQVITARYDKRAGEAVEVGRGQWASWYRRRKTDTLLESDPSGEDSGSDDEEEYEFLRTNRGQSKAVLVAK